MAYINRHTVSELYERVSCVLHGPFYADNTPTQVEMRRGEGSVDYVSGGSTGDNVYQDMNEHLREGLSSKVTALKSLTIDIGREVKHHNRMLEEMDTDFDSAGGLLGAAMAKVRDLARHSPSAHLCYVALFSLAVFCVLYWVIKL